MRFLTTFLLLLGTLSAFAQPCDTTQIPYNDISVVSIDSENGNHLAWAMIDGDPATYYQSNGSDPFPHTLILSLGTSRNINQLTIRPRQDQTQGRLRDYEIYISDDSLNWGNAQAKSQMVYIDGDDRQAQVLSFGMVKGKFLKLEALSNDDDARPYRWTVAELEVWEDPCGTVSRQNQTIEFDLPDLSKTVAEPITLDPTASSGNIVEFELVAGPATISNGILTFTGSGKVQVLAKQAGDNTYYPTAHLQEVTVLDPNAYPPVIQMNIHENFPLEMSTLKPYPVYAKVADPIGGLFEIDSVIFEVGNKRYLAEKDGDTYHINWQPDKFGLQRFYPKAVTKDGVVNIDTLFMVVSAPISQRTARTFYGDVIQFGGENSRWITKEFELPMHVGAFDSIHARFWTECPLVTGACDDWDRLAWIEVQKPNGDWVEIIRYITPYGRGCAHSIDLTDYVSVLQGVTTFRMFIDTWGTGGWGINLELDYFLGPPEHDYSQIDVLWKGAYSFGNPANLQPVSPIDFTFREDGFDPRLHLVTTGHGWGQNNTGNAAEFLHNIHDIYVDNAPTFVQDLWADCNPNPANCQPQAGTWRFDRAGWCPGAIANRYVYDLKPFMPQETINLKYRFDSSYVDFCHVNNPNCVSGVTCDNCNDGYNPFYQVSANVVTYYDSIEASRPMMTVSNEAIITDAFDLQLIPNPAQNSFRIWLSGGNQAVEWTILNLSGQMIMQGSAPTFTQLNSQEIDIDDLAVGLYVVKVQAMGQVRTVRLIKE